MGKLSYSDQASGNLKGYLVPTLCVSSISWNMNNATSMQGELRSLLSLIVDSAGVAERYISQREGPPQEQSIDAELRSSIYAIEAACAQLCSLIARPSDSLVNVSLEYSF
jgi:hypothetical protein